MQRTRVSDVYGRIGDFICGRKCARIMKNLSKICRCEVEICATKFAVLLNEILAKAKSEGTDVPRRAAPCGENLTRREQRCAVRALSGK